MSDFEDKDDGNGTEGLPEGAPHVTDMASLQNKWRDSGLTFEVPAGVERLVNPAELAPAIDSLIETISVETLKAHGVHTIILGEDLRVENGCFSYSLWLDKADNLEGLCRELKIDPPGAYAPGMAERTQFVRGFEPLSEDEFNDAFRNFGGSADEPPENPDDANFSAIGDTLEDAVKEAVEPEAEAAPQIPTVKKVSGRIRRRLLKAGLVFAIAAFAIPMAARHFGSKKQGADAPTRNAGAASAPTDGASGGDQLLRRLEPLDKPKPAEITTDCGVTFLPKENDWPGNGYEPKCDPVEGENLKLHGELMWVARTADGEDEDHDLYLNLNFDRDEKDCTILTPLPVYEGSDTPKKPVTFKCE